MSNPAEQLQQRVFCSRLGVETHIAPSVSLNESAIVDELGQTLTQCVESG